MSLAHKIISDNKGRAQLNSEDLDDLEFHGIYYMEHMNLLVKDRKQAELFYCDCLGFKLQPDHVNTNLTFHINLGQQQFHTVEEAAAIEAGDDFRSNKIFGNIGLVVPSLYQVCKNLEHHKFSYENLSLFSEPKNNPLFLSNLIYPSIRVTSPSGNIIYVYGLKEAKKLYMQLLMILKSLPIKITRDTITRLELEDLCLEFGSSNFMLKLEMLKELVNSIRHSWTVS